MSDATSSSEAPLSAAISPVFIPPLLLLLLLLLLLPELDLRVVEGTVVAGAVVVVVPAVVEARVVEGVAIAFAPRVISSSPALSPQEAKVHTTKAKASIAAKIRFPFKRIKPTFPLTLRRGCAPHRLCSLCTILSDVTKSLSHKSVLLSTFIAFFRNLCYAEYDSILGVKYVE